MRYPQLALDSHDRVIIAGTISGRGNAMLRLSSRGRLDRRFGDSGFAKSPIGPRHLLIRPGDRPAVAHGHSIAAFTEAGTPDDGFATRGRFKDKSVDIIGLADQSGRLICTSYGRNGLAVSRLNANGSIDTGFGSNGTTVLQDDDAWAEAILDDAQGRTIVVWNSTLNDGYFKYWRATRLTRDGAVDSSFDSNAGRISRSRYTPDRLVARMTRKGIVIEGLGGRHPPKPGDEHVLIRLRN